jgi:PAS domain S-box-containing protein
VTPREIVGPGLEISDGGAEALGRVALSQSVLDHAPIGMILTSAQDTVIWANRAMDQFLGISREQLVNASFLPFVFPDDRVVLSHDSALLIEGGDVPSDREFRWRDNEGGTRWGFVRTSIATTESGGPLLYGEPALPCLIRQIIDITERRTTERELARILQELQGRNAELERSNEELTQFAYVASHDLSEPLRVIAGHVDLLARRYQSQLDETADEYIAFAVDGCNRMRILIEDLLSYSRAGRELSLTAVDVTDVVAQIRINLSRVFEESGGTLLVGEMPTLQSDRSQLIQVFTNLVANSLKYAEPGVAPEIHISAKRNLNSWELEVADNGIGIAEEHRVRIFRIFQRLHGRDIPGTGIGLAICKKIIERQQGTIQVRESPYGGTAFVITLPIVSEPRDE